MKPIHILLALLVAMVWGVNFTVIRVGLGSFPPLLLAALRFAVAALPVLFLPRPALPWLRLFAVGATLFLGQFAFLFTGMKLGMPPGLASVLQQSQAFMTIIIASIVLHEMPLRRQVVGTLVAFVGLAVIANTVGGADFTLTGLIFCMTSALCWASGNVLLRGVGKVDMLALVSWLSLLQPVPLFILSMIFEGPEAIGHALVSMNWSGIGVILYIALLSTTLCYGIWSYLMTRYSAATVAPFSLLVPIFGTTSAALFLGETFDVTRIVGMMLVFSGLVVVVLPLERLIRRRNPSSR